MWRSNKPPDFISACSPPYLSIRHFNSQTQPRRLVGDCVCYLVGVANDGATEAWVKIQITGLDSSGVWATQLAGSL